MPLDHTSLQRAKKLISESGSILIIPHANVDPDGLSSALAFYLFLTSIGKQCTVLCPDTPPESLEFLPGFEKLEQELKAEQDFIITLNCTKGVEVDKLRYSIEDRSVNIIVTPKKGMLRASDVSFTEGPLPYDLCIVVDTADLALLGSLYTQNPMFFQKVPILNIDHHVSNTKFGALQLIDSEAASATEVLYYILLTDPEWKSSITPDIATLLLTGLITDTRSFQNPNTTPHSLEVAAELLDLGARQQEIIRFVYKTKPLSTLKIWGRALNHIQIDPKARIVWSTISREDLAEMGATSKETHGIIDELLTTIPDADIYILFTEIEEGGLKASMRSTEKVNVSQVAGSLFGGGGHARASGFKIKEYDNFQMVTLDCVRKIIEFLSGSKTQTTKPEGKTHQSDIEKSAKTPHAKSDGPVDILQELSDTASQ